MMSPQQHQQAPLHGAAPQQNGFPQHPQGNPISPTHLKYAKQAAGESKEDAEQASVSRIKREILIHWALVPPNYQMLRPIHQLLVSIHTAFPPAHGVPDHEYFKKWKPITVESISLGAAMNNAPDDEKLKKAVAEIDEKLKKLQKDDWE